MIGIRTLAPFVSIFAQIYKLIIGYELFLLHIIDNGRILMDFKTNPGGKVPYAPDGLVLDTQGNIFSTINGAGYVYKIDPMQV